MLKDQVSAFIRDPFYSITDDNSYISPTLEGETITFTVTRNKNIDQAATAYASTYNRSASDLDYNGQNYYELQFAAGESSQIITIDVLPDDELEGVESFDMVVYNTYSEMEQDLRDARAFVYIGDAENDSSAIASASDTNREVASVSFTMEPDLISNLDDADSITLIAEDGFFSYAGSAIETAYSLFQHDLDTLSAANDDQGFVAAVYQNLLNRTPDKAGEDFWQAQLEQGLTGQSFLKAFINGAYAGTSGDEDRDMLDNLQEVASYYMDQITANPEEGIDGAINTLLKSLSGDDRSVEAATNVIDYAFAEDVTLSGILEDQALFNQLWVA